MKLETHGTNSDNRDVYAVAGLIALVLIVFLRSYKFDFINFDDGFYVFENPQVLDGLNWDSFKWAFTTFHAGNWHPLTWLSLQLDVQLYGAVPGVHHAINVLIHAINAGLAFYVFERMTGRYWESLAVAALFAVHPGHVESIAWISERKDLLCLLFWLLTMLAYIAWSRRGAKLGSWRYVLVILLFALSLMAKPMGVTLPFVLILLDIWPLRRIDRIRSGEIIRLFVEKLPLFALAAASSFVTVMAQRSAEAVGSLDQFPIAARAGNAAVAYAKYLVMAVWPANLAIWYPYDNNIAVWRVAVSIVLIVVTITVAVWQLPKRRYMFVGVLWFVGTLVPVIGIVQVGGQAMADRYTYIPYFGLFIIVVFCIAEIAGRFDLEKAAIIFAAVVVAILSAVSFVQTGLWQDSETLYKHSLAATSGSYVIAQNLCADLINQKRNDEAEQYCRQSLEIKPDYSPALNALGVILSSRRDFVGAETMFKKAVESSPTTIAGYTNLANVQFQAGNGGDAETTLKRALSLGESDASADVYNMLATIYFLSGRESEAINALENAVRIRPAFTAAADTLRKLRPGK